MTRNSEIDVEDNTPLLSSSNSVQNPIVGATSYESLYHIVCVVAGTGLLQIPYAFSQAGWIGALLLIASAFVNWYTGNLIIKCLNHKGKRLEGYPHIGEAAFGKFGYYMVSFFYNTAMGGTVCLYLILSGLNLAELVGYFTQQQWMTIVALLLLVPYLTLKTLKEVGIVSFMGALASVLVVFIVIIVGSMDYINYTDKVSHDWANPRAFGSVLGTLCFSYGGNYVYPEVQRSMAKPQNFRKVLTWSMVSISVMYLLVGIIGYLVYGNLTVSPILLNLPPGLAKTFSLGIITFHVIFACPILLTTISCDMERALEIKADLGRNLLRIGILSFITIVSITLPFFSDLMNLVGAVSNTMLIFVLPVVCDWVLNPDQKIGQRAFGVLILLIGISGGSVGTYDALLGLYRDIQDSYNY